MKTWFLEWYPIVCNQNFHLGLFLHRDNLSISLTGNKSKFRSAKPFIFESHLWHKMSPRTNDHGFSLFLLSRTCERANNEKCNSQFCLDLKVSARQSFCKQPRQKIQAMKGTKLPDDLLWAQYYGQQTSIIEASHKKKHEIMFDNPFYWLVWEINNYQWIVYGSGANRALEDYWLCEKRNTKSTELHL